MKKLLKKLLPEKLVLMYHYLVAIFATLYYGFPSKKMIVIGVTGTKGKTSTINFIWSCLTAGGHNKDKTLSINWGELFEFTAKTKADFVSGSEPSASRTASDAPFSAHVSLCGPEENPCLPAGRELLTRQCECRVIPSRPKSTPRLWSGLYNNFGGPMWT